jgi:ParB-like chromosome segregation protein Spo0J
MGTNGKLNTPYVDLLPPLATPELEALAASVERDGVRDPITVDEDGNILDGHHRYRLRPDAPRRVLSGLSDAEKRAYVFQSNLTRRNLSPDQKRVALKTMKAVALALKHDGKTQAEIAVMLGVAQQTVSHWMDATNTNVGNGSTPVPDSRVKIPDEAKPFIFEQIQAGVTHVQLAADFGVSRQAIDKIAKGQEKASKQKKQLAEMPPPPVFEAFQLDSVSQCDIFDLKLPAECADMIFTDPPYHDEYLPLWDRLGELGAHILKPGGYLMAYCGKMFLPRILADLGKHLEYVWTYCVYQPDSNHKIQMHHLFQAWRPIVCFKRPGETLAKAWQPDAMTATRDKTFHEWQQQIEPPLKYIEAYTAPGQVVIDPFVGGGTTVKACQALGRRFVAFDKDQDAVQVSLLRLRDG